MRQFHDFLRVNLLVQKGFFVGLNIHQEGGEKREIKISSKNGVNYLSFLIIILIIILTNKIKNLLL
jgi:hypothetical protein